MPRRIPKSIAIGFWLMISALIAGRVAYYDQIVSPRARSGAVMAPSAMTTPTTREI